MFRLVDRSRTLSRLLERVSNALAKRRGLPVVFGILLVVVSFGVQLVEVEVGGKLLHVLGVTCQHMGVLIALIGLLLANPLGK